MKLIPLTQGMVALVDDEDYARITEHKWYARKAVRKSRVTWYAVRTASKEGGGHSTVQMSREIIGITNSKIQVDHKNTNTLDNQKENLRAATASKNGQNRHKQTGCSSRYKGVCWDKQMHKWRACITVPNGGDLRFLGLFDIESEAATAYDLAAKKLFQEFALTNGN